MSKSKFNALITASVMSAVYLAGVPHDAKAVVNDVFETDNFKSLEAVDYYQADSIIAPVNAVGHSRYILKLSGQAIAGLSANGQSQNMPRLASGKIDVNSSQVQAYLGQLKSQQNQILNTLSSVLGRSVEATHSFQYAFNGVAVYLAANEVEIVNNLSNVEKVIKSRDYFINTDAGPHLIGANNLWGVDGIPSADLIFESGFETYVEGEFGAGVVIGTLDTGINFDHPSFAEVGGDGYVHVNPLGSGNFLGVCDSGNVDQYLPEYTCNNKLIGGYDFVNGLEPVDGFDLEGPEDENGHGSHTASTSGGNMLATAEALGVSNIQISGVAPHATTIIFDVCYNNNLGQGLCPDISAIASVDQAIADGLVDVINFSIGGGTSPWTDPVSEAFLNATASGIFVATSAGNAGPGAGTLGHVEPWTASSGASTHNREFVNLLSITSPPGDPSVSNIFYNTSNGPAAAGDIVAGIEYAGNVDAGNFEGCNAFPASSFDGLVALISRGACSFELKVNNAFAAGAIAVIIHNNAAGALNMNIGTADDIPSFSISQADGVAMANYLGANTSQTVEILLPAISNAGQADVMGDFSSRGPSPYEYNKPDVTAPGVNILAAFDDSDPVSTGTPAEYGVISGTSMSSPHTAGAAALLTALKPGWSVHEVKSALMMTAVTAGVTKEDGVTPADPFDRGAGRIQVDVASQAGLVMDETGLSFALADPDNGGDPKTLNVPSITDYNCVETCTFQRGFRSVATDVATYDASVAGLTATVTPSSFTLAPGQFIVLEVEVDGLALPAGEMSFGDLVITENTESDAIVFSSAPSVAIPDDGYDGSLGSMACETIGVAGVTAFNELNVDVGIDHTWVGDLTLKLVNPDGLELGLMSRTGFAEAADDGSGCCGPGTDLLPTSPLTFADSATLTAEEVGANYQACIDSGECDFAPFPDTVAQPPSTMADMVAGTIDGNWMICAGDSVSADTGTLETVAIKFTAEATVPELHLPMVIVGLPPEPEIDVTPMSLTQSQDPDTSTNQVINIANLPSAGADLNWSITEDLSLVSYLLIDQPVSGTDGIVSDFFDDGVTLTGAYSADAMVLSSDSVVEKMFFDGFMSNGSTLSTNVSHMTVTIYADSGGVPSNHPEDGLNGEVYTLTLPIGDPNLDTTGDSGQVEFNILGNDGVGLELSAGTYWVTAYANFTGANRWNWFAGINSTALNGHLVDPGDIFGAGLTDWTDLTLAVDPVFDGLAFNASRELACGASWLSFDLTAGTVSPSNSDGVTVTFDSTGLAAGNYAAAICIDSNDADEPRVVVPVTLTVNAIP